MRAFICEVDQRGLLTFLPEHLLAAGETASLAQAASQRSSSVVWPLLDDEHAEAVRSELWAGHRQGACGLLLNRAAELLPVASAGV